MKAVKNIRSTLVLFCMVFALIEALESDNTNNRPEPSIKRTQNAKLFYSKECQDDINRYCLSLSKSLTELSDLAVLQCIHNKVPDLNLIDKECHHLLYEVKKNLTINLKLDNSALQICREDLAKIPDCQSVETEKSGHLLSCILANKEKLVTNECRTFITNVAALVFSDYRLISGFITDCGNDIERFSCGRIEKDSETRPTQQGKTIECLTLKFNELAEQCRVQITRVVELQSDDFHLDRPLYFACRDDREKFCPNVRSGNGAVYKCLMRNKFNTLMSSDCQEQLTRRQKVIVEDAFADKTLVRACKQDIIDHDCKGQLRDEFGKDKKLSNPLKLAGLILCLESAIRDGDRVSANCEEELIEHRKILMSDYQLNPGIVKKCSSAIAEYCGNGLERGGKTLHCLMHYAKLSKSQKSIKVPDDCINELRTLIKIADASEDVRVDSDLQEACQNILTGTCRDVSPGKGRVIECLMNQLNKPEMNEDCEERLLEIQFFASRDWRLTPQLYRSCKDDAIKFCKAKKTWQDWSTDVDNGPLVLPCLYHHLSDDDDENDEDNNKSGNEAGKVSKKCEEEIRKVMIIRAKSINLLPEVQEACYADLSRYCSEANVEQKGEEMRCLQVNLKNLEDDCQKAVSKYTERENKDVRLDQILMRACEPIMNSYCADKKDGKGDLLECLIKQKNNKDIDAKCRMGIEHHQLLNMQNVNFNYKFKRACRKEIADHCASSNSKIEVVRCLSDIMLNDTLLDRTHRLNDMCRSQLRFETLQLNEDIKLDKDLDDACKEDAARLCGDEKNGRGDVLECLRANQRDLNDRCKKKLLSRDRINLVDQKGDYKLLSKCRDAISQYCDAADENADLIGCLRKQLLRPNLELGCRKVVIDRIMEQNSDARLNPSLWSACHNDAKLGCQYEFTQAQETADSLNGRVIKCLKGLFVANRLSKQCEVEIDQVMREAALVDYRLDPLLVDGCLTEISELCSTEPNDKKEDCLRLQFQRGHIAKGSKCFEEVRRLIIEGAADVFTDHEMSEVCAYDLNRYCSEVPPGGSQQLKCLLGVSESKRPLSVKCSDILNSREQLWKAAKVSDSLSGFNDLARLINQSEHRSYLLVSLFFIIASVFVLGCFCRPVFRTRSDKMK